MEEEIKKDVLEETEQEKKQSKTGRNFMLVLVIGVIILGAWMFSSYKASTFSYNGITGNVVKEGQLTFYQTSIPVIYQGEKQPYYIYLRNKPQDLSYIPFEGSLEIKKDMVINSTGNLSCGGMGTVGVLSLVDLYQVLGTRVVKNETIGCPIGEEYMFLQLEEGNQTKITQTGATCYTIEVANCETIKVLERFIVETLTEVKKFT